MLCCHVKGCGKVAIENMEMYKRDVRTCNKLFVSFTSESVPQMLQVCSVLPRIIEWIGKELDKNLDE